MSNNCRCSIAVFLYAPAASWLISPHIIEEVGLENCIILQKPSLLFLILAISEMRVVLNFEAVCLRESLKAYISLDLVILSQSKSSLWDYLTLIFDSKNSVKESILFNETSSYDEFALILFRCISKRINIFWIYLLFVSFIIFLLLLLLDVHEVTITLEWSLNCIVFVFMKFVDLSKLFENHIRGRCKVESLSWELILLAVGNSHCDVVVPCNAAHSSPEQKFLKISFLCVVQKLLQSKVQSQSMTTINMLLTVSLHH